MYVIFPALGWPCHGCLFDENFIILTNNYKLSDVILTDISNFVEITFVLRYKNGKNIFFTHDETEYVVSV